jgi:CRISPR system Cascade subunit CasD
VLGRRSCPLTRPLYETKVLAKTALDALSLVGPMGGTIYSDEYSEGARQLKTRDVPIIQQPRQFASRMVYMSRAKGDAHVPE